MTSSFTITSSGFTYSNNNDEDKYIIVDGENNKIDFQNFEITTPAVTCREFVCYKFINKTCLQTAVDLWVTDRPQTLILYGPISSWDTSKITDMSNLFEAKTEYNHNISNWDTSNVTNMDSMFLNAERFNIDISVWDVNNVLDFQDMFENSKLETSFSETKRNAIHAYFNTNEHWPYQWDDVSLHEAI